MALMAIDWNPSPRHLRQFAGLGVAALLVVTGGAYVRHGWSPGVAALAAAAPALGVCGALWPRLVRPVYLGVMAVTFPIGWAVSHLVLAVAYFGVFAAVALVFRLTGRDALRRRLDPSASTYWEPKARPQGPRRYLQQF
jgi:hypothetical protein